jgi:hypothetical protein
MLLLLLGLLLVLCWCWCCFRNLNFNMLGGNLTALQDLPEIFPNLIHLG